MKILTRNLLAELLLESFEDRIAAMALHCLASCCRTDQRTLWPVTIERLLIGVSAEDHEAVLASLQEHPFLAWSANARSARVSPAPAFADDWQIIADKLTRFSAALREWSADQNDTLRQHALRKGALLFNHHLFFEVHEVLEAQWLQETGREKLFFQGLIQVAVAFYHLENANLRGAQMLLQDGMAKLFPYRPAFLGVELQKFLTQLAVCRAELMQVGANANPRFHKHQIPSVRFIE